jgi:hypothetical protein
MKKKEWPFDEAPNVAVISDYRIVGKETWIYYVSHDVDDGAWQFHGPDGFAGEEQAVVVSLKSILDLDDSIAELADLPLGWCAWRKSKSGKWLRAPQEDLSKEPCN